MRTNELYDLGDIIFVAVLCIVFGIVITCAYDSIIENTKLNTEIGESVCGKDNVYDVNDKQIDVGNSTQPIYKYKYNIICYDKNVIR